MNRLEATSENQDQPLAVHTRNLRVNYNTTLAVKGANISVFEGDTYGIIGPNGAGKTSLLHCLAGISRPTSGTITLFGKETAKVTKQLKQNIGYVPQEPVFYPWMTGNQLARFCSGFYKNWDNEIFGNLAERTGVDLSKRFEQLSGGTKAKLSLALTLAHKPKLLILDEPSSALDPISRWEFLQILLNDLREKSTTIIIASHRVDELAEYANRVSIVNKGHVIYEGAPKGLTQQFKSVPLEPQHTNSSRLSSKINWRKTFQKDSSEFFPQSVAVLHPPIIATPSSVVYDPQAMLQEPHSENLSLEQVFVTICSG